MKNPAELAFLIDSTYKKATTNIENIRLSNLINDVSLLYGATLNAFLYSEGSLYNGFQKIISFRKYDQKLQKTSEDVLSTLSILIEGTKQIARFGVIKPVEGIISSDVYFKLNRKGDHIKSIALQPESIGRSDDYSLFLYGVGMLGLSVLPAQFTLGDKTVIFND